jgi:WD domain, G-beta repeat
MPAERNCSQCGAPLPENAPGGRCPKCLVQLALEESGGGQDDVAAEAAHGPGIDLPGKTIVLPGSDVVTERTGMMILAHALRQNPKNEVAAARILSALSLRGFAIRLAGRLKLETDLRCAAVSPDGLRVITASDDDTARVWDVGTAKPLTGPLKHEATILSVQLSRDGQRIVTASEDKPRGSVTCPSRSSWRRPHRLESLL